jgi:hypothetical protein
MIRLTLLAAGASFALALPAAAQNFNIDFGTLTPVPSSTFGAAAAQPGTWNAWNPALGPLALVDIQGAATGVQITRTSANGYDFTFNHTGTSGDDEALLDDGEDPSPLGVYQVTGLAAGTYTVTTYAWAPDSASYITAVSVNGGPPTNVGGTYTGTYQLGVTHAVDTVTIPAGGILEVRCSTVVSFTTVDGLQISGAGPAFTTYCFGDGTGTACPCGNPGSAGNGCASSVSAGGAHLGASGTASISGDTFVLTGTLMPNSSALYFQGTVQTAAGAGTAFGDGLRCASGSIIRLGTKVNAGGTSSYPSAGDALISVKGANSAGAVRDYQCWYRNAAAFCTSATFNLTNGLEVTWAP